MRVVLDTNVLVSRFLSPRGVAAEIFNRWSQELFELVVSEPILAEYAQVLRYEKVRTRHRMSDTEITDIMSDLRRYAVLVEPEQTPRVVKDDPDDDRFLSCAVAGGAEYIVSGDVHLLTLRAYQDIQILSPSAFLLVISERP
jgi:uncharacterized protein